MSQLSRRSLLTSAALLAAGSALAAPTAGAAPSTRRCPAPIALQMWSLNDQAEQDLLGTLDRVAAMGYVAIESYDLYDNSPKVVRSHLDNLGLGLCSSHAPFPSGPEAESILDTYAELGSRTLVWSLEPEEFDSRDAILRGADRINEAVANARPYGMRIATTTTSPSSATPSAAARRTRSCWTRWIRPWSSSSTRTGPRPAASTR
jgi:sugar phosphate isomerase/epimerase